MKKLPTKLTLDLWEILDRETRDEICNQINEYLSNKYGYCTNSWGYDTILKLTNIDWDTEMESGGVYLDYGY